LRRNLVTFENILAATYATQRSLAGLEHLVGQNVLLGYVRFKTSIAIAYFFKSWARRFVQRMLASSKG